MQSDGSICLISLNLSWRVSDNRGAATVACTKEPRCTTPVMGQPSASQGRGLARYRDAYLYPPAFQMGRFGYTLANEAEICMMELRIHRYDGFNSYCGQTCCFTS